MATRATMLAKNAIAAKLADCYITIEGTRYNFMSAIDIEVTFEKTKKEVPILGRMNKGHKSTGSTITGSATFYKNTSIWNELAYRLQEEGEDVYFDMQISNYDPTAEVGTQTIILYDCNFDDITLAAYDAASEDWLEEKMNFTAESFEIEESFSTMDGMI